MIRLVRIFNIGTDVRQFICPFRERVRKPSDLAGQFRGAFALALCPVRGLFSRFRHCHFLSGLGSVFFAPVQGITNFDQPFCPFRVLARQITNIARQIGRGSGLFVCASRFFNRDDVFSVFHVGYVNRTGGTNPW